MSKDKNDFELATEKFNEVARRYAKYSGLDRFVIHDVDDYYVQQEIWLSRYDDATEEIATAFKAGAEWAVENGWLKLWKSVDEELPKKKGYYLVCNKQGFPSIQYWGAKQKKGEKREIKYFKPEYDNEVAYWMKIPSLYEYKYKH